VVPVFVPASAQVGRNYFIQLLAGVNGWGIEVLDDTFAPISSTRGDYGAVTGQFSGLANIWSTYRVNSVMGRFNPSGCYQIGSLSPTISIVDPLGGSQPKDFPDSLGWYSRSKTL